MTSALWPRESRSRLQRAAAAPPLRVAVSGFSRYSNAVRALPRGEQIKIEAVARFVVSSLASSRRPVHRIALRGHADSDTPRRPSFEMRMSLARARKTWSVLSSAIDRIAALRPGPAPLPLFSRRIDWRISGAGASHLAVPNARREADRARNRRVEIVLHRRSTSRSDRTRAVALVGQTPSTGRDRSHHSGVPEPHRGRED